MNFQELLKNKKLLAIIAGVVVIVLAIFLTIGIVAANNGSKNNVLEKPIKERLVLLTTDNLGKAIEIQSLLARQGIEAKRRVDGTKSEIYLENYKPAQRDTALMTIVKSGLMDQNVGLEIFDKGDFTSTREDKKIRYARAVNGELARLIKKLENVENATVFVSIPETKMFANEQKPKTAAVQVTLGHRYVAKDSNGTTYTEDVVTKLDRSDVKAITNLLMGAVEGLEQENITITDTEGNVYASLASSDDQLQKIEENDNYMKSKIQVQLDQLIGKGNYVVSVSTSLTQAPIERTTIGYDPSTKTAISEQTFSEGLGDRTQDSSQGVNAVSVYLPNGLPANSNNSAQSRSYSRTAKEVQYGVSKVQKSEYVKKGVIEDISIAVTLDEQHLPQNVTLEELKALVAKAASPKVNPENVTIAFSDSASYSPHMAGEKGTASGVSPEHGNPWWISIVLIIAGLIFGLKVLSGKISDEQRKSQKELEALKGKTEEQEKQLKDINLKAAELLQQQSQLAQNLLEQQNQLQIAQQPNNIQIPVPQNQELSDENGSIDDTLSELSSDIESVDENEMVDKVMSWIEKS